MLHLSETKFFLALDGLSREAAVALTQSIGGNCAGVKIHSLLDAAGPSIISDLKAAGARRVWVDHKIHDTHGTVASRIEGLCLHGADIVTVHASGGKAMLKAALRAAAGKAEIWAVTILTSLGDDEIGAIYGRDRSRLQIVTDLAHLAKEAGVTGVVCSALEVAALARDPYLEGMKLVVPGTRSSGESLGQQMRSAAPKEAIEAGATHLVIGSQVTKAGDPMAAFAAMVAEIT